MKKEIQLVSRKNHRLLHMQIKDEVLKEYYNGNIPENTPCPSSRELVRKFNTSKVTIGKVFQELKKDRIIYSVPGLGAFWGRKKNLVQYKTVGICFAVTGVVSRLNSPYFFSMLEGIEQILAKHNLNIKLLRSANLESINEVREAHCDAFICTGMYAHILPVVDNFTKLQIPYLLLDRPCENNNLNYLERDSEKNIYDMTRFLIDKGYDKVGLIEIDRKLWVAEKVHRGYAKAMQEAGIDYSEEFFKFQKGNNSYFKKPSEDKFSAFCKSHTALVIGALHRSVIDYVVSFFLRQGINIPEDCALLSLSYVDDLVSNGINISCAPTTPYKMGLKAGEAIVKLLTTEISAPLNIEFKTDIRWKY